MLRLIVRKVLLPGMMCCGLDKLFCFVSKGKRIILMYHGIVPEPDFGFSVNHLAVSEFEKHLRYLKKNFTIKSLNEIMDDYRNDVAYYKPVIALTFDDGYANNYHYAYPLLQKYGLPATIFAVTSGLENPDAILWYDYIDSIKNRIDYRALSQADLGFNHSLTGLQQQISDSGSLKSFLKKLAFKEKQKIIDFLQLKGHYPDISERGDFLRLLNAAQMKEMTDSGLIEIGSHTHTHPNLAELTDEEAGFEVSHSRKLIEEATGKPAISIAFPDGSYSEETKALCKKNGYKNLLAVKYRLPTDRQDKSILPRFCISNTTTAESNFLMFNWKMMIEGF
jgi:peptidoglycan/xylan/chitin deacetylase (PgdA/CDA1 family)